MSDAFKDHFSAGASGYARYRPRYPEALFAYLASICPEQELAWDCGTGNGQAALGLAAHFARVVATDASADQLAQAPMHPRVAYRVAPATQSALADGVADLVTVAQALHWFDLDGFYAEVQRVLKPGGVLAAWTYNKLRASPAVDAVIARFYADVVGPYWPPERRYVQAAYRTLAFPFEEIDAPAFHIDHRWRLADLLGYLGTWSATQRYRQAGGADPIDEVRDELARAWGAPEAPRNVRWRLHLRVGRRAA